VRRRLTVAMVLMVFGALILAGLASLALEVHNVGVQTRRELVREAQGLALTVPSQAATDNKNDPALALRNLLRATTSALRLQGSAVVAVTPQGVFIDPARPRVKVTLPSGLSPADLRPTALLAGSTVSGTRHGLVFAAAPYTAQLQVGSVARDVVQVVVLTRRPPSTLGGAGLWFTLASLAILIVAVMVARRLARRIVAPLKAAEAVTSRIAAGDLESRVPEPPGADPEMAALAQSVNAMADHLQRSQGSERQFLLSVSHDLRTPLTSIRGFAEAIEDGMAADVTSAASVIASEARRLERLVGDLLALANLQARRFTLRVEPLDLVRATAATVAGFAPAASELGLSLVVDPAPLGVVAAVADPDRLAQVTANLVENALRYAAHEVRVVTSNGGGRAELSVTDDGPGIAAEDLPRVFDRLFVARPRPIHPIETGRPIGTGLGLAIVAELVSAMGGSVRAESPLSADGGTRMVVALPAPGPTQPVSSRGPVQSPG
jgi:two-component system, OmpR family, sensor kinase